MKSNVDLTTNSDFSRPILNLDITPILLDERQNIFGQIEKEEEVVYIAPWLPKGKRVMWQGNKYFETAEYECVKEDKEKIPWKFNNPNCNIDEYYESWFTEHLFDKPVIKSETEILIR
ncbi:hypothetical protein EUA67_02025 [TM7 phylum sp. oral taxon 352]|jgi:hypothetical protein|nr:hypothetical protein EUA67_02025 [TM7 phylum sp. oral taxon 352]